MTKDYKQTLEKDVRKIVRETKDNARVLYDSSRCCHEMARIIRNGLLALGYEGVVVRDGRAEYKASFWKANYEKYLESMKKEHPDYDFSLVRNREFQDVRCQHSWCEIGNTKIDFHVKVQTNKHGGINEFLLVSDDGELDGQVQYTPRGKEFGLFGLRFVYLPSLNPTVRRIRL